MSVRFGANTSGNNNTAFGNLALDNSTSGSENTALGRQAGTSVTTASGTLCLGHGVTGENVNNRTWIRNVGSTPQNTGLYVTINTTAAAGTGGQFRLGYVVSSRRYKEDIKPMDKASEALYALQPVTYRMKPEADPDNTRIQQFGLIAEDVEKINPNLVARDEYGRPMTVRYDSINNMLLNEFLKEHKRVQALQSKVEKQETVIAQQQKGMEVLTAQLKEQAAQIQKVSAQLETSKPAPKVVANQ